MWLLARSWKGGGFISTQLELLQTVNRETGLANLDSSSLCREVIFRQWESFRDIFCTYCQHSHSDPRKALLAMPLSLTWGRLCHSYKAEALGSVTCQQYTFLLGLHLLPTHMCACVNIYIYVYTYTPCSHIYALN